MFDSLSERLTSLFNRLRGKGALTEDDVSSALREIRLSLLEADVHYKVVKELIERIRERAIGSEVFDSLTPGQQVLKIVRDELAATMGEERRSLSLESRPSAVILVGLQGSGKTTTAAKLAASLKKDGRKPFLVACDLRRPAAVEQLERLGEGIGVPVFKDLELSPPEAARAGLAAAADTLRDVVIVDTAGRLQIDEDMMAEIGEIAASIEPVERILVVDAMTGQEAVNVAVAFDERIDLTGVILAKADGDARGGAALSIRHVTGVPIVYLGMGERVDRLEPFHPKRMAERILGMGDVLTLIERAEEQFDGERAKDLVKRIRDDRFTLQDFLEQLEQMRRLGPLSQLLEHLPGGANLAGSEVDEMELRRTLAILRAMTVEERLNPSIIGGSRKKRIARGSGTKVRDVNRVLSHFEAARRALKSFGSRRGKGRFPADLLGAR
ncbi:MAG TPA: signal recognition particle protein [Candidatus Acetothermia bacterium]|nr:signal recognition particle protein [Candidatus Acetothermia bacterium]